MGMRLAKCHPFSHPFSHGENPWKTHGRLQRFQGRHVVPWRHGWQVISAKGVAAIHQTSARRAWRKSVLGQKAVDVVKLRDV